jgi:hypothetical protein
VKERAGGTLEQIGLGSELLNRKQMAQQLRERIDKKDYMKQMLLHNNRSSPQIEEAADRMEEYVCQL